MDVPLKKIVRLLSADQPETRAAAALILGELGAKDAEAAAAVVERLTDADAAVRLSAVRAAGKLKLDKALPVLLEKVGRGGPEAAPSAEAAAALGAKGVKGLQELLHKVAPGLRRYVAAALTSAGGGADAAGLAVLFDKDPQISAAAASAIIGRVPSLAPARKKELADELIALATDKKNPPPATADAQIVRVLVSLNEPAAADVLWDHTRPPRSPDVRAMALQAVGGWVETPTKDQWKRLFACAAEADFRVAAPALMILSRLPVADKMLADWVPLLHAPDVAARRLGIDKLGDRDHADVAAGLVAQLEHPDRGVRDAARDRLVNLKAGRAALVDAVLSAPNAEAAWPLARTAAGFAADIPAKTRDELFDAAKAALDSGDHRADAIFFLLREADHTGLQDKLVEAAVALRKKKKYEAALGYLKTTARDPSIGFAVRLELALCGLKVSDKEVTSQTRADDPALRNLDTLLQQDPALLLAEVEKAKFLDADDLFYVGFHFAEQIGRARQFGIDVLKLVLKRDPKSDAGKAAKNKLKSVGA